MVLLSLLHVLSDGKYLISLLINLVATLKTVLEKWKFLEIFPGSISEHVITKNFLGACMLVVLHTINM